MRSIPKALGLAVALLAVPALAQTVDGGQGNSCTYDTDCGDICGWVCDWNLGKVCVPAIAQAKGDGSGSSEGWCGAGANATNGCACPGQTCSGTACTPASFSNSTAPLCICDSDCSGNQHCDSTLGMCEPTVTACNYDGECGCGCFCLTGACECTGAIPQTCNTSADCGPTCSGLSCVGGACVHDEASCVVHSGTTGGTSGGSATATSASSSSSSASSSAASSTGGSASASASSSASAGGSSGGSSGGACGAVGVACTGTADCCGQYCKNSVCACNKATNPAMYACVTQADCCSGTCTNGKCLSAGSSSGGNGSSSGGATTTAPAGSGGGSSGGSSAGTSAASKGGCSTGGTGPASLALLAMGLLLMARRKRA